MPARGLSGYPARVKALVLESNGVLRVSEVPMPAEPETDSVLVRIAAAGICGSDLHRAFEGGAYHTPLIMGHEMAGVVEEAPPSSGLHAGQRVAVFPLLPCRRCGPCQTGDYAQCEDYDYFGSRRDGGFAEYLRVPAANLFAVPDHLDLLHAAMTEPCAVALHGVRRLRISPGTPAAVYGGGPIGNMVAQWLRVSGCTPVFVVEVDQRKLGLALEMGFQTVDGDREDPVEAILDRTAGGAACVVEACGLPLTFLQALRSAARFGQVVLMGNLRGELRAGERDISRILRQELTILGTWNSRVTPLGTDDWSTALRALGREILVAPLISHTPPLEEGPAILEAMHRHEGSFNKVIFRI